MKAVVATLRYTDCLLDEGNIAGLLVKAKVMVIKTIRPKPWSIYGKIKIMVPSYSDLCLVVDYINKHSTYGVTIVKWREKNV